MHSDSVRWVLRFAVPALLLVGILALVRRPVGHSPSEGMLRITGRLLGARVRVCREFTREELANIPKHMQLGGQTCEQSLLPYHLQVWIGGQLGVDEVVRPAGVRGDRPLYVQKELLLKPGAYPLRIRFMASPASQPAGGAASPAQQALARAMESAPHFDLDVPMDLAAGRVFLVELDEAGRRWISPGNER